jgi:hypothetical protein
MVLDGYYVGKRSLKPKPLPELTTLGPHMSRPRSSSFSSNPQTISGIPAPSPRQEVSGKKPNLGLGHVVIGHRATRSAGVVRWDAGFGNTTVSTLLPWSLPRNCILYLATLASLTTITVGHLCRRCTKYTTTEQSMQACTGTA